MAWAHPLLFLTVPIRFRDVSLRLLIQLFHIPQDADEILLIQRFINSLRDVSLDQDVFSVNDSHRRPKELDPLHILDRRNLLPGSQANPKPQALFGFYGHMLSFAWRRGTFFR
jgi:hypothetical protein